MPAPCIVVLEPDAERGERLRRLIRENVDAQVVVAPSGEAAIAALWLRIPDVILVSPLLPLHEEARLCAHFKRFNSGPEPPVLIVPPPQAARKSWMDGGSRLFFFARRSASAMPSYDPQSLCARIREALQESRSARSIWMRLQTTSRQMNPSPIVATAIRPPNASVVRSPGATWHRRAHRWVPLDLPWQCSVDTRWGLEARVLNISRSGALIESQTKLAPETSTRFRLSGAGTTLVVPARVVRSEVAAVDVRGVKYRMAAAFEGRLELLPEGPTLPTQSSGTSQGLAELLARVTRELGGGRDEAAVRAMFEEGVRRLVSAREIAIRHVPVMPPEGNESIYFRVPGGVDSRMILQAIFEPNHEPTAEEFELLKAAAAAAAIFSSRCRPSVSAAAADEGASSVHAVIGPDEARSLVRREALESQNAW